MTTKSEAMKSIIAGRMHEVFTHETMGSFDVTALRMLVALRGAELHRCLYSQIRTPDGTEGVAYIVGRREVDEARCKELTDAQLEEPLLMLLCPAGVNGPRETHLLVDGIHRFVERHRRGKPEFWVHIVPLDMAPKIDMGKFRNVPWGKKEVIPGVGLVDREEKSKCR